MSITIKISFPHNHGLSWGFALKNKHIAELMHGSLAMFFYFKTWTLDTHNACKKGEVRRTNESDALYGKRHEGDKEILYTGHHYEIAP
jgi:hypothetical protein